VSRLPSRPNSEHPDRKGRRLALYKHVVLGLLFLKYISDSFEARRDEIKIELAADGIGGLQLESLLENRDEYTAERVFWVPPEARWQNLQNQAARPEISTLIDDAILAVERDTRPQGAFYDALAENGSARDVMKSDTLRLMARELAEMVKKMPKLDWTQRESVRASLRRNVRQLLAKFGYPPDLAEGATQLVLRQAELSTENAE